MLRPHRPAAFLATVGSLLTLIGMTASPAGAATATETVTAGSLSFINSSPTNVSFPPATLTGLDLFRTQTQTIDVSDATGSASGWSITATSTQFTNGAQFIPVGMTMMTTAPSVACDAGSTCTLPTNGVGYPYTLPSGTTAPPATKMFNAATSTGMGNMTITPTWRLTVPGATRTGNYTSTWTFTLTSGP